jgi:hypothetical protein
MHNRNTWFEVLDASRRALSNAIIPIAIGALWKELLAPERPQSLLIAAEFTPQRLQIHQYAWAKYMV